MKPTIYFGWLPLLSTLSVRRLNGTASQLSQWQSGNQWVSLMLTVISINLREQRGNRSG